MDYLHKGKVCLCVLAAAALLTSARGFAQNGAPGGPQLKSTPTAESQASSDDKSTIERVVKLVQAQAVVRDKHGKIVSNLASSDFTLLEDGKAVSLKYFSRDTNLPLTAGLLVDTSYSQRNSMDQEKSASGTFFDKTLRDKDRVFLVHFDKEVELSQDLTDSRQKLENALQSLQARSPRDDDNNSRTNGGPGDDDSQRRGVGRGMYRGGTTLYDAIYLASDELLKKEQGRKALIVLSDGVDRGSKESLDSAIEAAQRADAVVYAVLFKSEESGFDRRGGGGGFGYPRGSPGGGGRRRGGGSPQEQRPDGKKILERIAKETGGHFFEVSKKDPIDQIYATVEEELRNQYSLGFTPGKADSLGYHKLELKTQHKDDQIQTREGFYLSE
jgi:VWFA-related protein